MIVSYLEADGTGFFVCVCRYDEREIPKGAGWRWDHETKRWFTTSLEKALKLEQWADAAARSRFALVNGKAQEAIAASLASESDVGVPTPPGLALLPYQRAGVAYALARRDTLIADEMGLGKTIQAIGVCNVLADASRDRHRSSGDSGGATSSESNSSFSRVLVVAPASLRLNWEREWKRWHTGKLRPVIVTDAWPGELAGPICAILSYEGAIKWKRDIDRTRFDVAIFDECHYLKTGSALRTRAVFGGMTGKGEWRPIQADRRLFLTGTPILNRPEELWPLLHAIDPKGLGAKRVEYKRRYIDEPYVPFPGAYNQANLTEFAKMKARAQQAQRKELHDHLRARVMVRRLKADVLKDLPSKRRQVVLIDPDGMGDTLAEERAVISRVAAAKAKLAEEIKTLPHGEAVKRLSAWRGAALSEISRIRHETALKKLPQVIEHLFDVLDEADKIVIFAHHHDVIDGLAAALPGATVVVDGRVDQDDRQAHVDRFQKDRGTRLFVGGIHAAGLGLTLTAASTVLFAELDWTPARMVQAEDRLHRIGQRDSVLVQHLVVDGSIDQRMSALLIQKAELIDAVLDGKMPPEMQESVLEGVLR